MQLSLIICCGIFMTRMTASVGEDTFVPVNMEDTGFKQTGNAFILSFAPQSKIPIETTETPIFSTTTPEDSPDKRNTSENLYGELTSYYLSVNNVSTKLDELMMYTLRYRGNSTLIVYWFNSLSQMFLLRIGFRVTGVVFKNYEELPWDVEYEIKRTPKFKNLSIQLCHSVHTAFSQNKTLERTWTKCDLLHTKRGPIIATVQVCLDKDLLDQQQVQFNPTRMLTTIKTLLDDFPRAPLVDIPYFGVVTCIEGGGSHSSFSTWISILTTIPMVVAQYLKNQ
ncbi:hypothetical protein EG68_00963 [Paragonimus skrjabini miyazakii]|uniref:Uncharacterized protein n=1 Tax=Paragonimus skrjabini miyazakii TaxID=59628 RepID=A0A8S9Z8B5_9TREM|nr:hypothetical protein EG68_00963 [Paragonimus skrjabini miyazakii]